ncbi:MAG: NACHT domain-containing protein [Limnospira sp.]
MASNQQDREYYSEAYGIWDLDRLNVDIATKCDKSLSPNAQIFLRGVLCGKKPKEIADDLDYQSKDDSATVRTTLSEEVYPTIRDLLSKPDEKIDWRKVPQLLKDYKRESKVADRQQIDWREVCSQKLAEQQQNQKLRRAATQMGFEVKVFVRLGLVESKKRQQRNVDLSMDGMWRSQTEIVTRTYQHKEFLKEVISQSPTGDKKHIAIVGEAGAGKTTLLDAIATYIKGETKDKTEDLYIFISLASLQGEKLKDYILKEWLPDAITKVDPECDPEMLEKPFQKRMRRGGVWLLLDGVDEVGDTSSAQETLYRLPDQLTDWLGKARVVLTSRTHVWDADLADPLPGFATYKTQEFYDEQVGEFIEKWFGCAEQPQLGQRLQAKLKEPERDRIFQLVKHPLRLAFLCQIFYLDENAELPETKAELYDQFVSYFYNWKPEIYSIDWNNNPHLIEELHQALGRVAIAGLDSQHKYRLPENMIVNTIHPKLFDYAIELNWLVRIDKDAKIYTFFHNSFQDYFATLALSKSDFKFFFDHFEDDVERSVYRIFEPEWQEIFIFWIEKNIFETFEINEFIENFFRLDKRDFQEFYVYQIFPTILTCLKITQDYRGIYYVLLLAIKSLIDGFYWDTDNKAKILPDCFEEQIIQSLKICKKESLEIIDIGIHEIENNNKRTDRYLKLLQILYKIDKKTNFIIEKLSNFYFDEIDKISIKVAKFIIEIDSDHSRSRDLLINALTAIKNEEEYLSIIDCFLSQNILDQIGQLIVEKLCFFLRSKKYWIVYLSFLRIKEIAELKPELIVNSTQTLDALIDLLVNSDFQDLFAQILIFFDTLELEHEKINKSAIKTLKKSDNYASIYITLNFLKSRVTAVAQILDIINTLIEHSSPYKYTILSMFLKDAWESNKALFKDLKLIESIIYLIPLFWKNNQISVELLDIVIDLSIDEELNLCDQIFQKLDDEDSKITINLINYRLDEDEDHENQDVGTELYKNLYHQFFEDEYEKFTFFISEKIKCVEDFQLCLQGFPQFFRKDFNQHDFIDVLFEVIVKSKDDNLMGIIIHRYANQNLLSSPKFCFKVIELFEKIDNFQMKYNILYILQQSIHDVERLKILVSHFKKYVHDSAYDRDTKLYLATYPFLWHCSKHMTYKEFYEAWHSPSPLDLEASAGNTPTTQRLNIVELPTTLKSAIADNSELNSTFHLICIDRQTFSDPDNPATDIYLEMLDQGCPEWQKDDPETLQKLKTYWRLGLRTLDKTPVFIFYNTTPDRTFSESFLDVLETFGGAIALISTQTRDRLQCFSPDDPELIQKIPDWLRRTQLES